MTTATTAAVSTTTTTVMTRRRKRLMLLCIQLLQDEMDEEEATEVGRRQRDEVAILAYLIRKQQRKENPQRYLSRLALSSTHALEVLTGMESDVVSFSSLTN